MIRAGRPASACSALAVDQRDEPVGQVHRGDDQLLPGVPLRVAGQEVEQGAGVLAELGPAGEEAEVGVEPRGGRVVVAGAEVDVAADAVVLAADDQGRLAVGLEADDPVDDVDAGLLEHPGLDDVVLLVEPGLELDQGRHLLAVLGGAGQGGDDRVVVGGAVERLLDRQDLRVVGRLLDELDDRAERLVGVVDQDVLLADRREDVGAGWPAGGHLGLERGLLQVAEPLELAERRPGPSGRPGRGPCRRRGRRGRAPGRSGAGRGSPRRPGRRSPAGPAAPHFRWRRVSWIVESRLLLTSVSWIVRSLLRVTRKADPRRDPEAAEEGVEPGADHVLEQDEPALAVALVGQGDQPAEHRGDLEHGVELPGRVLADRLDPQDQVQALVVQVRERVRRVDRQRGQDGVDLAVEVLVEEGVLRRRSARRASQTRMPCSRELGADLVEPGRRTAGRRSRGPAGRSRSAGPAAPCRRAGGPGARGCRRAGPGARRRGPRRTRRGSRREIARNRSRSSSGFDGSRASSSTRSLKSSQLSSRLMNRLGSEARPATARRRRPAADRRWARWVRHRWTRASSSRLAPPSQDGTGSGRSADGSGRSQLPEDAQVDGVELLARPRSPWGSPGSSGGARNRGSLTRCRNGSRPSCPAPIPAWRSTRLPHSRRLSFRCQTRTRPSPTARSSSLDRLIVLVPAVARE